MAMEIPSRFKPVTQYVRRAEKLDRAPEPEAAIVAYHCRLYAIDQAIKLQDKSDESNSFLMALVDRLEKDKAKGQGDTKEENNRICTDWALKEFKMADDEDRAGLADQGTARAFYAAGVFFDTLRQFGEADEETDRRRIYCKWKAAQILKALKEGRAPTPGGAGEDVQTGMPTPDSLPSVGGQGVDEEKREDPLAGIVPEAPTHIPASDPSQTPLDPFSNPTAAPAAAEPFYGGPIPPGASCADGAGGGPIYPTGASAPLPSSLYTPFAGPASNPVVPTNPVPDPYKTPAPAPYVAPTPAPMPTPVRPRTPVPSASGPRRTAGGRALEGNLADAMEYCRFAIRALEHKDVDLAVERLQEALRQIT